MHPSCFDLGHKDKVDISIHQNYFVKDPLILKSIDKRLFAFIVNKHGSG
jgi:hypothetical protein